MARMTIETNGDQRIKFSLIDSIDGTKRVCMAIGGGLIFMDYDEAQQARDDLDALLSNTKRDAA